LVGGELDLDNRVGDLDNKPGKLDNKAEKLANKPGKLDNKAEKLANKPVKLDNKPGNLDNKHPSKAKPPFPPHGTLRKGGYFMSEQCSFAKKDHFRPGKAKLQPE